MENNNPRIDVYSQEEFYELCFSTYWDDSNIEDVKNVAIISICGTEACREFYLEDKRGHYFNENHNNVLNVEFDDLTQDREWKGHLFKAMSEDDAKRIYDFIKENLGRNFIIHCMAGASRSQGICRFILDCFPDIYSVENTRADNPPTTPNQHVVRYLKRCFYNENNMFK